MASTQESIPELLRSASLRVTKGRVALLEVMLASHEPVALDDIDLDSNPEVGDRATVFRNLHALAEAGIVSMLRGVGKRDLYEISHASHHHTHITCTECGKTACLDDAPSLPKKAPHPKGWSDVEANLSYFGRCDTCSD